MIIGLKIIKDWKGNIVPKKVLAFTDPHGDVGDARKVVEMAAQERPDIIVCSGDFSLFGNNWRGLFQELSRMKRNIYLVGGNHEADGLMRLLTREYPFFMDTDYTTLEENGILVGGIPGYDRDFWPSRAVNEEVVAMAHHIWNKRDHSKPFVFLTHYPPSGAVDGLLNTPPDAGGSTTVASVIRSIKPDLVITGHYHEDFGCCGRLTESWIVNPGPSGRILLIDRIGIVSGLSQ
jgi:Icc-related predicted phosphoesterase